MLAKIKNVILPPKLSNETGNSALIKKLNKKFEMIDMLIPKPLMFKGKTSEAINKPTGPKDIEKETMNVQHAKIAKYFKKP